MSVPSDIHVPRGIVPGQPRAAQGEARGVEGIGGFQVALESASVKTIADQESEEKGEDDGEKNGHRHHVGRVDLKPLTRHSFCAFMEFGEMKERGGGGGEGKREVWWGKELGEEARVSEKKGKEKR